MPHNQQHNESTPAFVVEFHGIKVQCDSVEHVVETVKRLAPLEREVPVPASSEALGVEGASPVATAVYDLFRGDASWRRPVEIVRALKRKRIQGAKYTSVYAVLRYGDFVKREGRWNVKDAHAAF
jgi:hypothetical protein